MNTRENYYIDAVAGRYERVFPLARYADAVDLGDVESVWASLSGNLWFRLSDDARRRRMIDKVAKLRPALDELCALVRLVEPSLEVEHLSIGGSYLYCDEQAAVNDIDFNVIVRGSYFDYYDVYDIDFLGDSLTNQIRKISFTVFGASNVFQGTPINDLVVRDSYIHTDVTIREGLVFGWRNATLLGPTFSAIPPHLPNLLVRIDRQLYQARLLEEGRIGLDRGRKVRQAKAANRITEAALLLAEAFPHIHLPQREFLAHTELPENGLKRPLLRHLHEEVSEYRTRVQLGGCEFTSYETFEPTEAWRLAQKLEIHYTPKHGSWLNMAEIEFSVLSRQCLDRRVPDFETLQSEARAWQEQGE